jgi:very-short-patch-repair endonuclease
MVAGKSIQRARALRKVMSPPEVALWLQLRSLRTHGYHFRRQSPEGPYTLDFVCRASKLVIEVDGVHHSSADQAEHDKRRDLFLVGRGFRIMRVSAWDVGHELDGVMQSIRAALGSPHRLAKQGSPKPHRSLRYNQLVSLGRRRPTGKG